MCLTFAHVQVLHRRGFERVLEWTSGLAGGGQMKRVGAGQVDALRMTRACCLPALPARKRVGASDSKRSCQRDLLGEQTFKNKASFRLLSACVAQLIDAHKSPCVTPACEPISKSVLFI